MSMNKNAIDYKEIKIKNNDDLFDIIKILLQDKWFFRGQSNASWKLQTTLERRLKKQNPKDAQIKEWLNIQTFKKDAIRYFDYIRPIEWLATMQHYGAPTRLLDFTESIMVALYFAVENAVDNQDFCIWGIQQDKIWHSQEYFNYKKFNEDDDPMGRVAKKMFISSNIFERNKQALDFANDLIYNDSSITSIEDLDQSPKGVIPIYPLISNERLSAQSGLFLMLRDFSTSFENNLQVALTNFPYSDQSSQMSSNANMHRINEQTVIKLVFPCELVKNILQLLAFSNITPKTLFPGLDGIGKSINLL